MAQILKHCLSVIIIFQFIVATAHSQGRDTVKLATNQEKSEAIALRMERELSLSTAQSRQLIPLLLERFQSLERSGTSEASLKIVNEKAIQRLRVVLTDKQHAHYQKLRTQRREQKARYLKEHPEFSFSEEDLEMDF